MSSENWAFDEIADQNCQLCELYKTAQVPCLVGQGPRDTKVMIVGEAPGWREEDVRRVFSGKAGVRLDEELERVGLNREEIYITNANKCRPPDNRKPEREEIKACRTYLEKELEIVQPTFLLLLGNPALWSVLKKSGIGKHRGVITTQGNMTILATYHPAALFRNPQYEPDFQRDFNHFAELVKGTKTTKRPRVTIIETLEQLDRVVPDIEKHKIFAYDLETQGLGEWVPDTKIWCIGIATTPEHAWVIPIQHPDWCDDKWEDLVLRRLEIIFKLSGMKRIAHNGEFDNRWLRSRSIEVQHDFDTMIAAHLLNENLSVGLKSLARRYLGAGFYEDEVDVTLVPPPLKPLCKYCGEDVCYTIGLYLILREELLKDPQLVRIFKLLLMPATGVISRVESRGIQIDSIRLVERTKQAEADRERLIRQLNRSAPAREDGKEINWNSTPFLRKLLYEDLKLPVLAYTEKTKKPSTAEPTIKQLKHKHPIVDLILKYRDKDKQLSTFLRPWAEWSKYDERLHANYNLTGTRTGRLSSNDPNFQQTERGEFIRGIITARPGWSLISADLAQAEMRIAAMKSQDKNLMNIFQTKQDPHKIIACRVTGKTEVTKAERKKAKAINFGFLFGMGWRGFQKYALEKYDIIVSDEESQEARKTFFDEFPGLVDWHEKQKGLVKKFHYVRSPIGRIRHLPDIMSEDKEVRAEAERQAINSPVQSLASDMCLLAAVILDPQLDEKEICLVGLVHDALLFECKDTIINKWVPIIKQTFEHLPLAEYFGFQSSVPVEVDIKVSKYWEGEE